MAHYPGDTAGGPASRDSMPACTKKYHPSTGGYNAGTIESGGEPGEKEGAGGAPPNAPSDDGNHTTPYLQHGNYPHGTVNPDNLEGPPLASTDGGPNHSNY